MRTVFEIMLSVLETHNNDQQFLVMRFIITLDRYHFSRSKDYRMSLCVKL